MPENPINEQAGGIAILRQRCPYRSGPERFASSPPVARRCRFCSGLFNRADRRTYLLGKRPNYAFISQNSEIGFRAHCLKFPPVFHFTTRFRSLFGTKMTFTICLPS